MGHTERALLASNPRRLTARACRSSKITLLRKFLGDRSQGHMPTCGLPAVYRAYNVFFRSARVSRHIDLKKAGNRLPNRKSTLGFARSAGAGKNAPFSSRGFFARGVLGLPFAVGFCATDSHAPSNTWESVQKFGLPGDTAFLNPMFDTVTGKFERGRF